MGQNVNYLSNGFHGNICYGSKHIILEMVSMAMVAMERIPNNHCCSVAMEYVMKL